MTKPFGNLVPTNTNDPRFYAKQVRVYTIAAGFAAIFEGLAILLNLRMLLTEPQIANINRLIPLKAASILLIVSGVLFLLRVLVRSYWFFALLGVPFPLAANFAFTVCEVDFALRTQLGWLGVVLFGHLTVTFGIMLFASTRVYKDKNYL